MFFYKCHLITSIKKFKNLYTIYILLKNIIYILYTLCHTFVYLNSKNISIIDSFLYNIDFLILLECISYIL